MKLGSRPPESFGEKAACLLASALSNKLQLDQSKYIEVDLVHGEVRVHDRSDLLGLKDEFVTGWVKSGKPLALIITAKDADGMEFVVLPIISTVGLSDGN